MPELLCRMVRGCCCLMASSPLLLVVVLQERDGMHEVWACFHCLYCRLTVLPVLLCRYCYDRGLIATGSAAALYCGVALWVSCCYAQ